MLQVHQNIPMVDLKTQYLKLKPKIDAAIQDVINSSVFINGPVVKEFQHNLQNYLNVKHVIPCANGTDALQIALMALDLKPGDEVITANFTYAATAEVICLLGLTPILVEVNPNTFQINPVEVEKAITPRTKAIIPVHLFGQCAPMDAILDIAKQHQLFVVEDTAQAIGAHYTLNNVNYKAGTMGNIGCTSFFPSKNLGCYGDGGALFTNDDELAVKIKMIANHGQSIQYKHEVVGINSRLDAMQAAILNVKLQYLNTYTNARQSVAAFYDAALGNHPHIQIPERVINSTHVFHQYTLKLNGVTRDIVKEKLQQQGIASMVYYPVPLHKQKAFKNNRNEGIDFTISENLCQTVLSLPIHTEMTETILQHITSTLLNII